MTPPPEETRGAGRDRPDWGRLAIFTVVVFVIAGVLLIIDGDPVDPEGVLIGIGLVVGSMAIGLLLARFGSGARGRRIDVVIGVAGLVVAGYCVVRLISGAADNPLLMVFGAIGGGSAAMRLWDRTASSADTDRTRRARP